VSLWFNLSALPLNDPRSDQELVSALNSGDASAFEGIYFRYRDVVLRLAFRFTGNRDDALDVLQETFAYLFAKFPGFVLSARMTTFLFPAVRNLSLAARRKRLKVGADFDVDTMAGFTVTDDMLARSELAAVMSGLSAEHREVVLLRFVDGLTIEEISVAVSVPEGTIKSRLHHAIEKLRGDPRVRKYFDLG